MTNILSNFSWIDDTEGAKKLIQQLNGDEVYAIDTEFERSRTFYLNPALLQIQCEGHFYLVDLAIPDIASMVMQPIRGLLLHSGSEDLELYHQVTGKKPRQVFDTQVAAALCGYSLHTSYFNLVKDITGVELDKGMSRSDWLARPLSVEQLKYAIEDIAYLSEFKSKLSEQISEKGLDALFDVLMQQMIDQLEQDHHAEKVYQKLVKAERLNRVQAGMLWRILQWRDQQAQSRNKPRNWIINPQQIIQVIKKVKNYSDLFHVGLHPKFVKYNGEQLIDLLRQAQQQDVSDQPALIKLNPQQGQRLSDMKQRLKQVAERFDIEPSIIINVQGLKKMAFLDQELSSLPTWQALP